MALRSIAMLIVAAGSISLVYSQTVVRLGGQVSTIAPEFISFANALGLLKHFYNGFNTTDPKLAGLMHSLKPSILRVGGSGADYATYFSPGDAVGGENGGQWTITTEMADLLCNFAQMSEWKFVLGLNSQPGYNSSASHAWDDSNARKLLKYIASSGCPVVGFELGNELNIGANQPGKGVFTGQLQGGHFDTLSSKTLPAFYSSLGNGTTSSPWVIGPDVTQSGITPAAVSAKDPTFMKDFLSSFGPDDYGVDRVTWHQYQKPANPVDWYLDPTNLDVVMDLAIGVNESFSKYSQARVANGGTAPQLWLGETGVELNGHQGRLGLAGEHVPGLDDGFAGLLAFGDKLGLAMRFGHSVVVQQQLPNLVITDTDPTTGAEYLAGVFPSMFMSALWKQLAGTTVLSVGGDTEAGRTLRVYAVCAAAPSAGSAAVIVINVNASAAATVSFASDSTGDDLLPSAVYQLAPYPNARNITEPTVAINGKPAAITATGAIPPAIPVFPPPGGKSITVDPRTMAFVLVDGLQVCVRN